MDLSIAMQSLKHLFTFPFQDPRWKDKFLIGAGLGLAGFFIPLVPWLFLIGYGARMLRAGAANSDPTRLPGWDDWGELLLDGLRLLGVGFITSLPALVVFTAGYGLYFGTFFTGPIMGSMRGAPEPTWFISYMFSFFALFMAMGLGTLLGLAGGLVWMPSGAHVAVTRRFGSLFDFSAWWSVLRSNLVGFLLAGLMLSAIYFAVMIVWQVMYFTIILCAFSPIVISPLMFYAVVVFNRLVGQAYGTGTGRPAAAALTAEVSPHSEPETDAGPSPDDLLAGVE